MVARTIHPFPARMAPDIAMDLIDASHRPDETLVLDPMCGSGTVLSAAVERGLRAVGFDMDPLAVLMSRVATTPVDTERLAFVATEVLRQARSFRATSVRWHDDETTKFVGYWFGEPQRIQLSRLSRALDQLPDSPCRRALQIALSRTIITKAPKASLAADTSHSRPHRVQTESAYDVYEGFSKSVGELSKILDRRTLQGQASVNLGDSRNLHSVANSSIDLAITSPPYLNAIDYLRGHKMSLVWLGFTVVQLRKIRSDSIGAERSLERASAERADRMVQGVIAGASYPERLPIATIRRYANDIVNFVDELSRVTKPGGQVVSVVGNSTLRENFISNDGMVQDAFLASGFEVVSRRERDLPENRRYLPIGRADSQTSMSKRMRTEVVLTVSKT